MESERKRKKGKKKRIELSRIIEKEINGNRESGDGKKLIKIDKSK